VNPLREKQRRHVAQEAEKGAQPLALPPDGRISLFKDGKLASPFGAGWMPTDDHMAGGKSNVKLDVQPGAQADGIAGAVLAVQAQVKEGFSYPWAGVSFMPGMQMQGANLSAARTLRFRVRGDGRRYEVMMASNGMQVRRAVPFQAGAQWQEVSIPFSAFKDVDPASVSMIGFNAGPQPGDYRFEIADVRLVNQ
jgi:hypothetical protein